jgi:predicted MFS family arabinose efflux permease
MPRELAAKYREIPSLLWKLLATQCVMNASHFMSMPLLALYVIGHLHLSPVALGSVMVSNLLAAQLLPLAAGLVADRFGTRHLMVGGFLLRAAGLMGFAIFQDTVALCATAFLMGSGVALYESGVNGIFGRQPAHLASRVFIVNNQMLNLGVIGGPLLASLAMLFDIRLTFVASGILFVLLAFWVSRLKEIDSTYTDRTSMRTSVARLLGNRTFLAFLLVSMPWFFLFTQLYVSFPIHLSRIAGESAVPSIFLVNGIVGLAFMLASMLVFERASARAILPALYLAASILFAAVPLFMTAWWFLLFVALYTMVETLMLPSIETLTAQLADSGSKSTFFGALSVAYAVAGTAGYYAGSWLSLKGDAATTWMSYGGVGLIGFLLALWFAELRTPRVRPAMEKVPRA